MKIEENECFIDAYFIWVAPCLRSSKVVKLTKVAARQIYF